MAHVNHTGGVLILTVRVAAIMCAASLVAVCTSVSQFVSGAAYAGATGASASTAGAPATAQTAVCGASSLDGPATPPSGATDVPAGNDSGTGSSYQLTAHTTYWLAPGVHTLGTGQFGQFQPAEGDTFIGAPGAIITGQHKNQSAFAGTAGQVTIEYLTIRNFVGAQGQMVVNHTGGAGWTVEHDTVTDNGGAAVGVGTGSMVEFNCLSDNQEYGFSSFGGSRGVTLEGNEISGNDATGAYDHGKGSIECGCSGGGKFWETVDATVTGNYIHTNGNVGIWVDTNNAGFDISDNDIVDNYAVGIEYEISYNALISHNTLVGNAIGAGPSLTFPDSAIYISESGGDSRVHSNYAGELRVTANKLTNNWGGIVLWENSNRYCGDGSDHACTLIDPKLYTIKSCVAHLKGATPRQSPNYYDNCRWETRNVTVSKNVLTFDPSTVGSSCEAKRTFCGINGLFSEFGTTTPWKDFAVPSSISDRQHNRFRDNTYIGPWKFDGFSLGDVVTWNEWTKGFKDTSGSKDQFNAQDAGSTYHPAT